MSLDLPANIERQLELYARARHISATEAAVRLIGDALKAKKIEVSGHSTSGWDAFERLVPGFEMFQRLPEGTVEEIARASRRIRARRLTPRA